MKAIALGIAPVANLRRKITMTGSVVVCKSGAFLGYRIHWTDPSVEGGTFLNSEQLINGEAYMHPNGGFTEFWITSESGIASPPEQIELRVIDCATPVVVLNSRRFDGFRTQRIGGGNVASLAVAAGLSTLYIEPQRAATSELAATEKSTTISRGWIAGGISCDTPFVAYMFAGITINVTGSQIELARWAVTALDAQGKYSCSFENGGRSAFAAGTNINNGPGLLPWPAYGLKFAIGTNGVDDIANLQWLLLSRTGTG